jgi:hypothetical protein
MSHEPNLPEFDPTTLLKFTNLVEFIMTRFTTFSTEDFKMHKGDNQLIFFYFPQSDEQVGCQNLD